MYNHEITRKVKKNDKKFRELAQSADEERAHKSKLESPIEELNARVKSLKYQLEETEQASAGSLAKCRKFQLEVEGYRTKAEMAESQLSSMRIRSRLSAQVCSVAHDEFDDYKHTLESA